MTVPDDTVTRLILITGQSGAGKSTTIKQFEDLGWDVADNIPLSLLSGLMAEISRQGGHNVAVGVDSRTFGFSASVLLSLIEEMRTHENSEIGLLFLDCDDAVLQRRFTETRRRHPLASDKPVADGIRQEQQMLEPLKEKANYLIDSTLLSVPELRHLLIGQFSLEDRPALATSIVSFSFKKGVPREADMVFDVRFLQNPYYDPKLRSGTGKDAAVAGFVGKDEAFDPFMDHLESMLELLLPRYLSEGKSYLTIAIGCTGGRHRSVCVAENIHDRIERRGYFTHLVHRDLDKSGS